MSDWFYKVMLIECVIAYALAFVMAAYMVTVETRDWLRKRRH